MTKNNSFDLDINPYALKGRWYRAFIESNGSIDILTTSDLADCDITLTHLLLPSKFKVITHMCDFHFTDDVGSAPQYKYTYDAENKQYGIKIPVNPDKYDYGYIYFFGYFEE